MTWYSPGRVIFNRDECIWMIANVLPLEAGQWPAEQIETGYTGGNKSFKHCAPFEGAGCARAELEQRIEMTGEAGEALVDEIQAGIEEYDFLSRPAKRALNYISSGPRRRGDSYPKWCYEQKRKPKKVVKALDKQA